MSDGPAGLLLDMGRTFMFECDRFDDDAALLRTFRAAGGTLPDRDGLGVIADVLTRMFALYEDPRFYDRFPGVRSVAMEVLHDRSLAVTEAAAVESTIAQHEIGRIPESHIVALRRLRERFRLGVVSNIWSRSDEYRRLFQETGIAGLFDVVVFSSDGSSIKPSPVPFEQAISGLALPRQRIRFVGDDPRCDIRGAADVGLETIWVSEPGRAWPDDEEAPSLVVRDLVELASFDL